MATPIPRASATHTQSQPHPYPEPGLRSLRLPHCRSLTSRFFRPCGISRRLGVSGSRDGCELDPAPAVITSTTSPLGGAGSSPSSVWPLLVRNAAARALCALMRSSIVAAACALCAEEKFGCSDGAYRDVGICSFCVGATRAAGASLLHPFVISISIYQCLSLLHPLMNARRLRCSASDGVACALCGRARSPGPRLSLCGSRARPLETSATASGARHQASLFRVRHGNTARATRGARTDHRTRCTPSAGAHAEQGAASAPTSETRWGAVRRPALRSPPLRREGISSERSSYLYFSGEHQCTRCEREGLRTRVAVHRHRQPRYTPRHCVACM